MIRGKKGFGIGEIIMLVIILFVFAIFAVMGNQILSSLNDDLQQDADLSTTAKEKVDTLANQYPDLFDAAFITIMVLLFVVGIAASLMVDSHPVILIIVLVLMAFISIAAGFLSNAWEELAADDDLSSFASELPMTNWVLTHFLLILSIVVLTFGGIIYAKRSIV